MKKLAVLAMAGLMSVTASATNWVLVGQNINHGRYYYVDSDSITDVYLSRYGRSYRQAFVKMLFTELQYLDYNQTYDATVSLGQFDCKSNPKKSRSISILAQKNSYPVASYNYNDADWNIVYPGSLENMAIDYVCSYQK